MVLRVRKAIRYLREALQKPNLAPTRFRYRDIIHFTRFVRPMWKLAAISLLLSLVNSGLNSVMPLSSKVLIDFVILKQNFEATEGLLRSLHLDALIPVFQEHLYLVSTLIGVMFAIAVSGGLIGIVHRFINFKLHQEITFNLQTSLFDHLLRFPMSFFKGKQTGYLVSRVSDDVGALQHLFTQSLVRILTSLFHLAFGLSILLLLSIKLTLISLSILPIYLLVTYFYARRVRGVSRDTRESYAQVSRNVQEVLSGIEVVKAHGAEERESEKVSGSIRDVIHARTKGVILSLLSNYSSRAAQFVATLLIMWFGVQEIRTGAMSIGDYVAFTSYVVYLTGSTNTLALFHINLQPIFAAMDRLKELFMMIPEQRSDIPGGLLRPKSVSGKVQFDNVTFGYSDERLVLADNVSFAVEGGEVMALVGPSGAGKTTIVNLLLRFYVPRSGTVSLDGHDLSTIDTKWLRRQIGVVSQDIFLFNDTIANNIRYGRPEVDEAMVVEAAKRAHIHDDIEALSDRYETVVGERGATLSQGQRQRISIARAFLKDPPILILDEPTSALDLGVEERLKATLAELARGRTTIIISHRMSLTELADKVIEVNDGSVQQIRP